MHSRQQKQLKVWLTLPQEHKLNILFNNLLIVRNRMVILGVIVERWINVLRMLRIMVFFVVIFRVEDLGGLSL